MPIKTSKISHLNLRHEIKRCKASRNSSDIITFFCKLKLTAIYILISFSEKCINRTSLLYVVYKTNKCISVRICKFAK